MKVKDVALAWAKNNSASTPSRSFSTNGNCIYSYSLKIGYTDDYGRKILLNYTASSGNFQSHYTSRHVNLAAYYADVFLTPN